MIRSPVHGMQALESNSGGVTTAEFGTAVVSSATPHSMGSWTQLVAATTYNSYGIWVGISNLAVASTNARFLVDIGVGAASSEVVFIPYLNGGNSPAWGGAHPDSSLYYFPVFIPANTRISARAQGNVVSDTGYVSCWLAQHPIGNQWFGSRVTAYGVSAANSYGTSVAQSTSAYAATAELTSSCTYPVKYIQLGMDLLADTTGANKRGLLRFGVGATPVWVLSDIPFGESTTLESTSNTIMNFILSQMRFNIPAGTRLAISTRASAAENRGWILYGVD